LRTETRGVFSGEAPCPGAREAAEILLNGKYATMRKSRPAAAADRPSRGEPFDSLRTGLADEIQHVSNKMRPSDGSDRRAQTICATQWYSDGDFEMTIKAALVPSKIRLQELRLPAVQGAVWAKSLVRRGTLTSLHDA
jgi:hypothetical protein